jgi:hypothetical protein
VKQSDAAFRPPPCGFLVWPLLWFCSKQKPWSARWEMVSRQLSHLIHLCYRPYHASLCHANSVFL